MIPQRALEAIELSDTDELLRSVDGLCEGRSWDDLVELQERCREAVTRGKQLWGVEEHIRYRLALEAPGRWAGEAVSAGTARFALGPLPEVAASTKTWGELEPHLQAGPWRDVTAAERVVRGESGIGPIPDLPDRLMDWEPEYPVATYKADRVDAPSPPTPSVEPVELGEAPVIADPHSEGALADLVQAWVAESNGRCQVATVEGDAGSAIHALGLTSAALGPIASDVALAWMAWAGASGGAHGRRRGAAAGRYAAWWALATISDLDWPCEPDELGQAVGSMRFFWFDDGSPATGWQLRLAIEAPGEGLAWAISANDWAD